MIRAFNCNTNVVDLWVRYLSDSGAFVNVSWKADPANAGRGQVLFDLDETAAGGGTLSAWSKGYQVWSVRASVPVQSPNGVELGTVSDPLNASIELEPSGAPFPARAKAIRVRASFQGAYVFSKAFSATYQATYGGNGQIPYFPMLCDFDAAGDGDQVLDQLCALIGPDGQPDTHIIVPLSTGGSGYDEPGQPYGNDQIIPESNYWADFSKYLALVDNIISRGKCPVYFLSGEGSPDWLQQNFASFVSQMRQGYDRLAYGPVMVVYDGVWPATWSVAQMQQMIPWMRSLLGASGYLGFFFGNGTAGTPYLYVENEGDYTQPWMDGLDIVLTTTGPDQAQCPALANLAMYMVPTPTYSGSCTPGWQGPMILAPNSRGERVWGMVEWLTYECTRDPQQAYKATVEADRARMFALGIQCWG